MQKKKEFILDIGASRTCLTKSTSETHSRLQSDASNHKNHLSFSKATHLQSSGRLWDEQGCPVVASPASHLPGFLVC